MKFDCEVRHFYQEFNLKEFLFVSFAKMKICEIFRKNIIINIIIVLDIGIFAVNIGIIIITINIIIINNNYYYYYTYCC